MRGGPSIASPLLLPPLLVSLLITALTGSWVHPEVLPILAVCTMLAQCGTVRPLVCGGFSPGPCFPEPGPDFFGGGYSFLCWVGFIRREYTVIVDVRRTDGVRISLYITRAKIWGGQGRHSRSRS
ncbi:hypothetical protein HOY82DRAFT_564015 [Tuber indicum]|nr:hypothetical protein HOY82DRAFT_564015 [Tuber indicum]